MRLMVSSARWSTQQIIADDTIAYMDFIFERLRNKNPDGSLQIMYVSFSKSGYAGILNICPYSLGTPFTVRMSSLEGTHTLTESYIRR